MLTLLDLSIPMYIRNVTPMSSYYFLALDDLVFVVSSALTSSASDGMLSGGS